MDILGIGPLEFLFILIIALIVLGPKDMVKAGKTIGRVMRTVVSSDTWRVVQDASREMRNLPNRLMREAGVDDLQKQLPNQKSLSSQLGLDDLNKSIGGEKKTELSSWTTPPPTIGKPDIENAPEGADSEAQPEATASTSEASLDETPTEPDNDAPEVEQAEASGIAQPEPSPDESGAKTGDPQSDKH